MNGMRQMLCRQSTFVGILSLHTARCFSPALVVAGFSRTLFVASSSTPTIGNTGMTTGGVSSTAVMMATGKKSFPTWTFDEACKTMEWSPICNATLSIQSDASGLEDDADFVLIGVPTPIKDDTNDQAADEKATTADEEEDGEDDANNKLELDGLAKKIDEGLDSALTDLIAESKFKAKSGASTSTLRAAKKRYALLGVDTANTDGFEIGKAIAAKLSSEGNIKTMNVLLPDVTNTTVIRDLTTSLYQALYSPDARYKSKPKPPKYEKLEKIQLFSEKAAVSESSLDDTVNAISEGKTIATGIILAKDIVNAPHNVLNSQSLAETARRIPGVACQIWGRTECEAAGMGAYLGVARGSETEPQFIVLTYEPPESSSSSATGIATVGVVGKGLLFDTGGYNIKTSMMELMKFDCGGAAAVFGAARAIGELKPPNVKVHFIVAACENMINERAYVPSDILTASNGKTIEVMNTDAEGRLTLADALVYADKTLGCEKIIELSTLTGACMVSLGKQICGLWTANDDLAAELASISKATGDKAWRMPMAKEYNELLESKFADLKNIGTSYGGAITAALFLQNFVSSKKPFAHLDIAGPVWDEKIGATGFGTKLVVEWIIRQGKS